MQAKRSLVRKLQTAQCFEDALYPHTDFNDLKDGSSSDKRGSESSTHVFLYDGYFTMLRFACMVLPNYSISDAFLDKYS